MLRHQPSSSLIPFPVAHSGPGHRVRTSGMAGNGDSPGSCPGEQVAGMSLHTHMLLKSCMYCSSPRPPSTSLSSLRRISSSNCREGIKMG